MVNISRSNGGLSAKSPYHGLLTDGNTVRYNATSAPNRFMESPAFLVVDSPSLDALNEPC